MKAGQAVLEALRAEGVEYTFGVVRGATQEIADAVKDALASNGPSVIEVPVAEHFPAPAPHARGCGPALKRSGRSSA